MVWEVKLQSKLQISDNGATARKRAKQRGELKNMARSRMAPKPLRRIDGSIILAEVRRRAD